MGQCLDTLPGEGLDRRPRTSTFDEVNRETEVGLPLPPRETQADKLSNSLFSSHSSLNPQGSVDIIGGLNVVIYRLISD